MSMDFVEEILVVCSFVDEEEEAVERAVEVL